MKRRVMSFWRCAPPALAALLAAGTLHAQSAPPALPAVPAARLYLDYQRGPGAQTCASAEQLALAVEARLGRRVFVPAAQAQLHAELRAQRVGRGYRITLQLFDRDRRPLGRRQLSTQARHCSALDEALALVVSLAADVTLPEPSAEPARPVPLDTPLDIPATAPAPRQPWQVRLSAGVTLLGGFLPGAALAAALEVELAPAQFWPFWLRVSRFLEERVGVATGAELTAHGLELGVCPWTPRGERFEARLCAQQLLGLLHAQGFGSDDDRQETRISFGLGVEQTLGYRSGNWFVSVSGSLLVTPVRRRYYYLDEDQITLHEQGWIWAGGRLALGLQL